MPTPVESIGLVHTPAFPTQPARTNTDYINPPMVSQ